MIPIASAVAAAASSAVSLFTHGHGRKDTSSKAPATTGNLFSSLLQSIEQVAGVSVTGSATAAAGTSAVTGTPARPSGAAATALGNKFNASA